MKMKKTTIMSLLAVIMFFMAFPAQVCAKKIKFGQYVVYSGKVENGMPKGEGELTIVNNDPNFKEGAFFKGVFDGYTISGKLDLKAKRFFPYFNGAAQLEIAADGSYVRVNIITGSLTAEVEEKGFGASIRLYKKDSVSIVCTPTEQGIIFSSSNTFEAERKYTNTQETKFSPYYYSYNRVNRVLYDELNFLDNGSEQSLQEIKWYGHSTYMLNKSGHLVQKEYYESIKLPKLDATLNLYEDGVQQIDFGNGDFLRYKRENDGEVSITGFSVKMQYKDMNGKLCLKNHDDVMKFIKDDGEEYNAVSYDLARFGTYTAIAREIERQRMFNAVTPSDRKLELGRFILYKDTVADLVKNAPSDNQSAYDLGIALVEGVGVYKDEEIGENLISDAALHNNADAKAYKARKEAKAAAKVLEENEEKFQSHKNEAVNTNGYTDYRGIWIDDKGVGCWAVGKTYETGESPYTKTYETGESPYAFSWDPITINLDSALVWYEKAAQVNPKYKKNVIAIKYKMETGKNYFKDERIKSLTSLVRGFQNKYKQKYGASFSNNIIKGNITQGMPLALIKEYIRDYKSIDMKQYFKHPNPYDIELTQYEPSVRDMYQFGRNVQVFRVTLDGTLWLGTFKVANGKVVTVSDNGDGALKSMEVLLNSLESVRDDDPQ